MMLCSTAL